MAEKLVEVLTQSEADRPTPNPPISEDRSDRFVTHVLVPAQADADTEPHDELEELER